MLFNRNGYVLNFSTADFDVFTTNSIGIALCNKYGLSKGKSLIAYLNSTTYGEREKLFSSVSSHLVLLQRSRTLLQDLHC